MTGKGAIVGSDPGNVLIPLFSKKIGCGRDDEGPGAQSRCKEIYGYNPVPVNVYLSFHLWLLFTSTLFIVKEILDSSPTNPF